MESCFGKWNNKEALGMIMRFILAIRNSYLGKTVWLKRNLPYILI